MISSIADERGSPETPEGAATALSTAPTANKFSGCCGPAKSTASKPKEGAPGCCGPSTKSESSPAKKSGCC